MTKLADTLDALDANTFPATVRIAPEVLNGLQALQPDVVQATDHIAATPPGSRRSAVAHRPLHRCGGRARVPVHLVASRRTGEAHEPRTRAGDVQQIDDLRRPTDERRWGHVAPRPGSGTDGDDTGCLRGSRRHDRAVQPEPRRADRCPTLQRHRPRWCSRRRRHREPARRADGDTGTDQDLRARTSARAATETRDRGCPVATALSGDGHTGYRRPRRSARRLDHCVGRRDAGTGRCDARRRCPAHRPADRQRRGATRHTSERHQWRTAAEANLPAGKLAQRDQRRRVDAAGGQRPAAGLERSRRPAADNSARRCSMPRRWTTASWPSSARSATPCKCRLRTP